MGRASTKSLKEAAISEEEELLRYTASNEVVLVGRVNAAAKSKELPSGDRVVEFRLIVDRAASRGKKREVDTLDIAAWSASARKSALAIKPDQWVEVRGAVRRRFWQASGRLPTALQVGGR